MESTKSSYVTRITQGSYYVIWDIFTPIHSDALTLFEATTYFNKVYLGYYVSVITKSNY